MSSVEGTQQGTALCLSGGGYRAMLFHLGVLWYLNDARYLKKIARFSSVSGGSITNGTLASRWTKLGFDASGFATKFVDEVVKPVRALAGRTIDVRSVLGGIFGRGSAADRVRDAYDEHLFHGMRLDQLPMTPRFTINATNVQTGSLVRFTPEYIADYRVGQWKANKLVAEAVTASSAFPPVLSPFKLKFAPADYRKLDGATLTDPPYTTEVVLTDGGVYDNMGIETALKNCSTILVSDAGGKMGPEEEPKSNAVQHSLRVNGLIDNQVRSLRKREVMDALTVHKTHTGTYWSIRSDPKKFTAQSRLDLPAHRIDELAKTPTRLAELDAGDQERLINFGYAMAERALRSWVDPNAFQPEQFPYERTGV